jgi:diacylglycerol kinase (ATP)
VRTAVIFNPQAGKERGDVIASKVERLLTGRGFQAELYPTQAPNDAKVIAHRLAGEADIVVAVGGDGTINEVANGLACAGDAVAPNAADVPGERRCKATLGIVPAGTVNVLALELGIPFETEEACDIIVAGKKLLFDLGKVNDRRFTLMMGAGIDALTVRNIDLRAKRRFRELAFVGTGLKTGFAGRPPVFLAHVNGRDYRTTFFVAGNARNYAGRFGITPEADPTDGILDLMLFTGTTRSSLAVFWMEVPRGLHTRNPNVISLRATQAELTALDNEDTVWFQTDGELAGSLPASVTIDHHALRVLVR